jgi:diguanylate cyclase (GGDEF)-like protein/PAS domain S-box-containing protein
VERIRAVAPAGLSLLLIMVVAVVGFAATHVASDRAQQVHIADRNEEQATLAGLGTQYVLFGFKEEINFATSHSWSLRQDDPTDVAQLRAYAGQSALLGYGAALVDYTADRYIATAAQPPGLPPLSDPGMRPLLDSLEHHGPGLSSVMHVGDVPLVAYAVTLTVDSKSVGFLGFSRLNQSPLETYVTHLHFGNTGRSYVLDSNGVAIAASDPTMVGKQLPSIPPLTALARGKSGYLEYGPTGSQEIATFDPIDLGGWGTLTTQSAAEFFGPINSGILRVEGALALLLIVAGGLIAFFIYRRHVALRHEMKTVNELAEARERFRHAFEETPVGMALIGVESESMGRFVQVNRALCELTGFTVGELLKRPFSDLLHADNADEVRASANRVFVGDSTSFELEIRLATKAGSWRWALLHGSLIRDPSGRPLYGVAHVEDISERKAAEQRLQHLALHDSLTNLPNRVLVAESLSKALKVAGRYGTRVGVLYLDLDNFKEINDTFGHDTGDRILEQVAERIRGAVRPEDTPARIGGDEFVVVCAGVIETEDALNVAERIEAAIESPIEIDGEIFCVKASTGISIGGGATDYADQLLRDADSAMYMAKRNGRGRVEMAFVD